MKKITKIMALVLTFSFTLMCFAGCGLIKDMDELKALEESKKYEAEQKAQMESVVLKIADNIEVNGAYYGWFFNTAYNAAYSQASQALSADSSAASDATPEVDMDAIKADVQKQIVDIKMAYKKAVEAGIELTKEDEEAIAENVKNIKTQVAQGTAQMGISYEDYLMLMGTDSETVNQIVKEEYIGNLYLASLVSDSYVSAKHILVKFGDEDRTKEEAEKIANEIKAKLDSGDDFDKLMEEKSEDGRDASGKLASPNGYTFSTGEMVPEFEAKAFAMKDGEISEPVLVESEGYNGFHIIKKVPTSVTGVASALSSSQNTEVFTKINAEREALAKDVKVEETDKINFYTETMK
ncbi:MAG: hypothetical protein E7394_02995 [Ruminococcaceae bacterium]|nr:hypothetical protein [Oscillospiraceae bacterium]